MKTETIIKIKNLKDKYVNKYTITDACVVAAALIVWAVVSIIGYYTVPADNPRNSEIANSGFGIECGDRIVASLGPISNAGDDSSKIDLGIISTNSNGTDMKVIRKEFASCLNTDGTYIYYINNTENGNICRMKPDGSEWEKIADTRGFSMIYDDGYLFVFDLNTNNIISINTKTFEKKTLVERCTATTLTTAGDKLYFFGNDKAKRKFASVNKKGGNVKFYFESAGGYSPIVYKGYVYFIEDGLTLKKVKLGSKQKQVVGKEQPYRFFIQDDKIYYLASKSATDGGAFVMDMNGENVQKICKGAMRTLSISHDMLLAISTGYQSEPFLYVVDSQTGAIVECYDMTDEERRAREIYENAQKEANKTEETEGMN